MVRNAFGLVFMMTLVGTVLVTAGLVGYEPPAHTSLDPATWRRGTWSDQIVVRQVGLGAGLLIAAGLLAFRINRRNVVTTETRHDVSSRTP
jgi:hypothetical protein